MSSVIRYAQFSVLSSLMSLSACWSRSNSNATTRATASVRLEEFQSDSSGFDTKSYFLDTGKEVVVFDAQFTPALADKLIQKIRQTTKNPITHVIVTHPNPDKFGGLSQFAALGATIVSSEKTKIAMPEVQSYKKFFFVTVAKMFKEAEYPTLVLPNETFKENLDLKLNGIELNLKEIGSPGVSPDFRAIEMS
jgi:glyoxylase-like metal-dependent hydrolase (beta-lactamase superfamily II)